MAKTVKKKAHKARVSIKRAGIKKAPEKSVPAKSNFLTRSIVLLIVIVLGFLMYNFFFSTESKIKVGERTTQGISPTAVVTEEIYTVKPGETLRDIAVKIYGDANAWVKIVQANNLKNPNSIHAGNVLRIPR